MKAFCDKKTAVNELLKDFRIQQFRVAGTRRERIEPAVPVSRGALEGIPRSAVSEIWGPPSSGKTSLMLTYLAETTRRQELCALVDATDAFDPWSGSRSGMNLENLLWVRCGGRVETALKATDILLHGGGFGLAALDLGGIVPSALRKIPAMYWYRFRRAAEESRTALLVVASAHITGSCAAVAMAASPGAAQWSGTQKFRVLQGLQQVFDISRSENPARTFTVELRHAVL